MSKEGSLARIEKYKETGRMELAEKEEKFYKENYGEIEKETPKKAKK